MCFAVSVSVLQQGNGDVVAPRRYASSSFCGSVGQRPQQRRKQPMAETAITSQLLEEAGLSLEFQEEGTRLVIRAGGGPKRSAGAEVVAALLKADRRIRALDLRHSQLNDNGLAQISLVVRQTDQLEELHCHPVGHTGLQFLLGLVRRCSRLRILSVEVCDCPTLFVGRQTLAPADFDTSDYTAPKVEVEDEVEDPEDAEAKAAAQVEKLRQLFAENDYDSGDETAPKEEPSGATGVLRKLLQELAKAVRETPSLSSVDCFGEMVPWDVKLDITRAAEEHQAQKQKRLAESQEAGSRTASDVMKDQMAEITSILQHMQESGIEGVLPGEEASQKPTFLPIRSYIARRLHSALGEALFECERFKSKENKALDTPQGEMAFLAMYLRRKVEAEAAWAPVVRCSAALNGCRLVPGPGPLRRRMTNGAKPPSTVANGRYQIEKKLGAGCFGEASACSGTAKWDSSGHALQLEHEQAVLKLMAQPRRPQGFAELFWCGQEQRFMCLDRLQGLGGQGNPPRFNPQTAVLVADQVLRRIEYLHSKGIVHRDIKPENFMFGIKSRVHHLYLIDFGLSKKYFDQKHVALRTQLSLTGTARYASINAHKGVEQSRRDDLEAIGHMLMYFLRGSLPWSGLDAKTQEEKYRKIREKKELTPLDELCAGFPPAFKIYLQTARSLEFKETLQCHCRHCRLRPSLDLLTLRRSGPTTSPYGSSLQMSVPSSPLSKWSCGSLTIRLPLVVSPFASAAASQRCGIRPRSRRSAALSSVQPNGTLAFKRCREDNWGKGPCRPKSKFGQR
eukprot:s3934_g2.t1